MGCWPGVWVLIIWHLYSSYLFLCYSFFVLSCGRSFLHLQVILIDICFEVAVILVCLWEEEVQGLPTLSSWSPLSFTFFYHAEVPRPRIEPVPQQWQHWFFNLLSHQKTPALCFLKGFFFWGGGGNVPFKGKLCLLNFCFFLKSWLVWVFSQLIPSRSFICIILVRTRNFYLSL